MEAICKADFDNRVKAHSDAERILKEAKDKGKTISGIIVPEIGFYDIYGVWFFGGLKQIIRQISIEQFKVDLGKMMHVFIDVEPKNIDDGIHDVTVYNNLCQLHKWTAQGYHRGLVVLVDDVVGKQDARVYRKSRTWSWV